MNRNNRKYLLPTAIIDSDHNIITDYVKQTAGHVVSPIEPVEMAVKLYYAVRDNIWYDPAESPFETLIRKRY